MAKRVINLVKATGQDFLLIKSHAQDLNININDKYQMISDQDYQDIIDKISKEPEILFVSKRGSKSLYSTDELPSIFNLNNPFADLQINLVHNSIEKRESRYIVINDISIETIFNDFEAYSICRGVKNSHAIKIAKEYFTGKINNTAIEAHEIAMSVYKKYGIETLRFALQFPPLPFQALDARSLFSELDKKSKVIGLPIIRVAYTNENGKPEKLELKFYVERERDRTNVFKNVIEVRNKTSNSKIASISRDGLIVPSENSRNLIPIIQLFVRNSHQLDKLQINYGLETGECSICGRELTDPISIKQGIGPICVKNLAHNQIF